MSAVVRLRGRATAPASRPGDDAAADEPVHAPPTFALPMAGEMLLTGAQVAAVLQINPTAPWTLARTEPDFPKPVRRGERFTRWKASELRAYIDSLTTGEAAPRPGARKSGAAK